MPNHLDRALLRNPGYPPGLVPREIDRRRMETAEDKGAEEKSEDVGKHFYLPAVLAVDDPAGRDAEVGWRTWCRRIG